MTETEKLPENQESHDNRIILEMRKSDVLFRMKMWGNIRFWENYDLGKWNLPWQDVRDKSIREAEQHYVEELKKQGLLK